jgi:peptidoglycan-associated lipoprotein
LVFLVVLFFILLENCMRSSNNKSLIALMLSSLAFIAACSTPVPPEAPKPPPVVEKPVAPVAAPVAVKVEAPKVEVDPLNDPNSILAKRAIYFDYDSYVIKPEFNAVVEAHAKYLVSKPARKLLLQGSADDRGSREYNLALGQKRSEAVRKALSLLGVPEAQVEAVSLGEEKATGKDEASWAQDRRADFVY